MSSANYPGIARATMLIALDNGGINCLRSEEQQRADLDAFLQRGFTADLTAIDAWLVALTDEQLEIACCGEATEVEALMRSAPSGTDQLLNDYFDEVC